MGVRQFLVLVIVALGTTTLTDAYDCEMCPLDWDTFSTGPIMARDSWFVEPGETCNTVYLSADNPTRCAQITNDYADVCCYEDRPGTQAPQPPPPTEPPATIVVGTEPVCHICFDHEYPRKPGTQIDSYYASGTCHELYHKGRNRNVGGAICYPLQLFAQEPCGCDLPLPTPPPAAGGNPPPSPAPVTSAPVGPPSFNWTRRPRPAGASKNSLKLSYGYRVRGSTNARGLRGEEKEKPDDLVRQGPQTV